MLLLSFYIGVFTWARTGLEECDLCEGAGVVNLGSPTSIKELPSSIKENLWFEDSDEK
jgi:hypothetical protein